MPRQADIRSAGNHPLSAKAIAGTAQTITLAGSSASDATKITSANVFVTTTSAGGAILPASEAGDVFHINNAGGNTMTLYPPTGATINGTTSLSVATAKACTVFFSTSTTCHSIPHVAT